MVIRSVRLILEFAIGAVIGAAILFGLIVWRVSSQPVSLSFLTPYLEHTLSASDGSFTVRLNDTELTWEGWQRTLDIRVVGVRAIGLQGQILASVPDMVVSLSLRGLLHGMVAPTSLEILSPRVRVVRSADGTLQLGLQGDGGDKAGEITERIVTDLLAPPDPTHTMGYLREFRVSNADLQLIDQKLGTTWHAPRTTVRISRDRKGLAGELELSLDLSGETAEVDAEVGYDRDARKIEIGASFHNFDPSRLGMKNLPLPELNGVALPLQGTITSTIDIDGHVETLGLDATGGPGRITLPEHLSKPLEIKKVELRGHAEEDLARLVVERAVVDFGGPTVSLNGQIYRGGGGATGQGELALAKIPVDELERYWPPEVGVNARQWIVTHLSKGTAQELHAVFAARSPDGTLGSVKLESLAGTMTADGVSVQYLPPMPPVENVSARSTFNADRFDVTILGGELQKLRITEGTVKITGLSQKDQFAAIEVVVKGPVRDVVEALDKGPLQASSFLGVSPADIDGESATRAVFDLPLEKDLKIADVKLAAAANLRGLGIRRAALGQDVTDGSLTLRADKSSLHAEGTVKLGGVPASLTTVQNFGPKVEFRGRYMVTAVPTDADLARIGFPVAPYVTGPVSIGLTYTVADGGGADLEVAADLAQTQMDMKDIGWSKAAGVPATAGASLSLQDNHPTALREFKVSAGTLTAGGSAVFATGADGASRMQSLALSRLAFGRTDVSGTLQFRPGGGFDGELTGPQIDLASQFSVKETAKPGKKEKGTPFTLHMTTPVLWTAATRRLRDVDLKVDHDEYRVRGMTMTGGYSDGKPTGQFGIQLAPDGNVRRLTATSNDAGRMLAVFGIFDDVSGGKLALTGTIDDTQPDSPFDGRLTIKDYRVVNTPVLAKILTAASLTGIINIMSGEGIGFTDFDAPVKLAGDTLTVTDARAFGPDLGLTMKGTIDVAANTANLEGTIVPAYAINSILGNIPIIGDLLTGGKGSGIFAATYRLTGPLDKPDVSLNPLAALTPGFLRNIFGVFGPAAPGTDTSAPNTPDQSSTPFSAPEPSADGTPVQAPPTQPAPANPAPNAPQPNPQKPVQPPAQPPQVQPPQGQTPPAQVPPAAQPQPQPAPAQPGPAQPVPAQPPAGQAQ